MRVMWVVLHRYNCELASWEAAAVFEDETLANQWMLSKHASSDLFEWKINRCPLL